MKLNVYYVNAFVGDEFKGNPAAVIPLKHWLSEDKMQQIAREIDLSETAFFIPENGCFNLRWFTPAREVDLCGHATLATSHVIFNLLGHKDNTIHFFTKSGELIVTKNKIGMTMDFPAIESTNVQIDEKLSWIKELDPIEVLTSKQDLIVLLHSQKNIESYRPNLDAINFAGHRGFIITAKGDDVDFVSRCFYPEIGIQEDPVTGSAHCQLAPYWSHKLHKARLTARQLSERGGEIFCEVKGNRVFLTGSSTAFMESKIEI